MQVISSAHTATPRMPVLFVPHGGGPWPFVPTGIGTPSEQSALAEYLRAALTATPEAPRALLVVSAHWEEPVPTVMTHPHPPLLYDYYGFPEASYHLTWPAQGSAELASHVATLLGKAGFKTATNGERGFDHGAFVPLKLAYPDANVTAVQLSLIRGLDPGQHIALGPALAPLRDQGVLIVGSGMSYHNLRAFGPEGRGASEAFDTWLQQAATAEPAARDAQLGQWQTAPAARFAHPREEHLLPLMVAAGAAESDRGRVAFSGTILGVKLSGYEFGS